MYSLPFARPLRFSLFPSLAKSRTAAAIATGDRPAWNAIVRGLALFLGGFSLLNVLGERVTPGFDANIWWIDLHPLGARAASVLLSLIGLALLAYAVRPQAGRIRRFTTLGLVGGALAGSLANAAQFYHLLASGTLPSAFPIPFSLFVAAALATVLAGLLRPARDNTRLRPLIFAATVAAALVLFPLLQMFCFGKTDYRRPADAIVVLGAKAHADGTPSVPLADRVRTACEIYHQGLAPILVFSGGPADGTMHETEAMRRMAVSLGVPQNAIILDPDGLNTQATVDHTLPIFQRIGARRVIAVSHFYHLPRIKLSYQRQGYEVFTVPARESYMLTALPFYMAREVAGLWVYYLGAIGS